MGHPCLARRGCLGCPAGRACRYRLCIDIRVGMHAGMHVDCTVTAATVRKQSTAAWSPLIQTCDGTSRPDLARATRRPSRSWDAGLAIVACRAWVSLLSGHTGLADAASLAVGPLLPILAIVAALARPTLAAIRPGIPVLAGIAPRPTWSVVATLARRSGRPVLARLAWIPSRSWDATLARPSLPACKIRWSIRWSIR